MVWSVGTEVIWGRDRLSPESFIKHYFPVEMIDFMLKYLYKAYSPD